MFGNIANNISNIGLGAVQKATVANADKDLGRDIAQSISDWNEFKKRKAFIDQLTAENPEDADKIMYDPEGYAKILEDKAKLALEQQYRLEYLDKQNQNAMALEGMRNQNAFDLARLQNSLKNGYDEGLREERLKLLQSELDAGRMSKDDYKKGVLALNLGGDVYKSIYGDNKPLTLLDFAKAAEALQKAGANTDALNALAENKGYGLTFNNAPKQYAKGDLGSVQYMVDVEGITPQEAWSRLGKMTPDQKLSYEVEKAKRVGEINFENSLRLEDRKNENAVGLENLRQEGRVDLANMNNQGRLDNALALEEVRRQNAQDARLQQLSIDLQKQAAQNELKKDFEEFKNTLPVDTVVQAEQISQLTGTPVNDILMQDYRANQIKARQDLADIDYKQAQTLKLQKEAENPVLSKEEAAYQSEVGKKRAQVESAEKDSESMKPALLGAMGRAVKALQSGNGVGVVGGTLAGLGLNTSRNAGANFADIQSANTQMNTYLRKQLAATGLTGSELNSAVEAEAYRYQISPRDPESVIMRKLQNFAQDKLGITPEEFMVQFVKPAVDYKQQYNLE